MKIAFYLAKNGDFYDWIISLVTFSKYSHCEIVFSDGMCASSSIRDGGIRFKEIDVNSGNWDVFELSNAIDEKTVRDWFVNNDADSYDLFAAVLSVLNINAYREDKKFCSQACGLALGYGPMHTPVGLYNLLKDSRDIQ